MSPGGKPTIQEPAPSQSTSAEQMRERRNDDFVRGSMKVLKHILNRVPAIRDERNPRITFRDQDLPALQWSLRRLLIVDGDNNRMEELTREKLIADECWDRGIDDSEELPSDILKGISEWKMPETQKEISRKALRIMEECVVLGTEEAVRGILVPHGGRSNKRDAGRVSVGRD